MKTRFGRIQINIGFFAVLMPLLMLFTGFIAEYAAAFVSITLHETGHLVLALTRGLLPDSMTLTPVGFSMAIDDRSCRRAELIKIYLAGPVVNLLIFGATTLAGLAYPAHQKYLDLWAATNLYLALFNLLPAYPLDGGRILREALAGKLGLFASARIARRLAAGLSAAMLLFGIYQTHLAACNFILVITGLHILFLLYSERMETAFMNIKQILYRRTRFLKKGVYPARDLVAAKSARLDEILKNMDFDRFHLIHVLDDDLKLVRVFTESEIMDAIIAGKENITFEDLC